MRRIGGILLFAACVGGFQMGIACAAPFFQIKPVDVPYRNVGLEAFYEQFNLDIDTPVAHDTLKVILTKHLPIGWTGQMCVVSNGSCYLDSTYIAIPSNGHERIQIDFAPPWSHEAAMAWIDVRIFRKSDPSTWHEISYALGYGVTLPVTRFSFTSDSVFQQANPYDDVPFSTSLRSFDNFPDSLIVTVKREMPDGWFAQFRQTSTGMSYSGNAVIPFPAYVNDDLHVDFFCYNPDPGIGNYRIKVQSRSNPAFWAMLSFRVRTGTIPAGAEEGGAPGSFSASVAPNPVRDGADLRLDLTHPSPVKFRIVDIAGRTVLDRPFSDLPAGAHRIAWDAKDELGRPLPSGTYFYLVTGAGEQASGKITIDR